MILSPRLFRQSRAVCFPPHAARHILLTFSGSDLLTNSASQVDIFAHHETVVRNKAHQHKRRLVTLDQSPFFLREESR